MKSPLHTLLCLLAVAAFQKFGFDAKAANGKPVWELAQPPVRVVPGAPKYSDVAVRSLIRRPANAKDPYDTFRMAQEFHVTRLDWCYGVDRAYVQRAKELGLVIGAAMGSNMPDAKGKRDTGRVTDKNGNLVTYKWMAPGIWAGCPNAPEYRAIWLQYTTNYLAAGVDLIQQDDPAMSTRTTSLCYCKYCTAAFSKYQSKHGPNASYEQFQQDSVAAFHREMHAQLDTIAGRHIPFSHNNAIGFHGKLDWSAPLFDFVNAEIESRNVQPAELFKIATISRTNGIPMLFQYRDTSVPNNRRTLATIYANGMNMLMPWDVYMPDNAPRYFGTKEQYADLSGFIRANAKWLDGYEHAFAYGPKVTGKNPAATPVKLEGGSGNAYAYVRAQPGNAKAPVVIHLVEWEQQGKPGKLLIRKASFWGEQKVTATLRVPPAYDASLHDKAQSSGDFSSLAKAIKLTPVPAGEWLSFDIPTLNPWGIVVIQLDK